MTERAEGFWWVRWGGDDEVVKVERVSGRLLVMIPGVEECYELADAEQNLFQSWGPYLGKEPETIESLERKISEAFAAAVPRFVVPPQRSEGEPVLLGEWRENPDPALDKELRRHERDD